MNKNLTKDGTNSGDTTILGWVNDRMSRAWWSGVFCGAFSVMYTWSLYKQYNAFLNSLPTLLGLIILVGFFLFYSLALRVFLIGMSFLLKKLWEIHIIGLGLENVLKSGLSWNQAKVFLIKVGVGGFTMGMFFYYFGEKYNSLLDSLPDWLKVLLSLGFLLVTLGAIRHSYLHNKRRLQNQHSKKENKDVTP